jgi:hypothetical protein
MNSDGIENHAKPANRKLHYPFFRKYPRGEQQRKNVLLRRRMRILAAYPETTFDAAALMGDAQMLN